MTTNANQLRERTKRFGFDIINLVKNLPRNLAAETIGRQLIRSGTAVAANHRAAGRARSRKEFIAKLGIVVEEADESEFWLEALTHCQLAPGVHIDLLHQEASALRAIFSKSVATAREHLRNE